MRIEEAIGVGSQFDHEQLCTDPTCQHCTIRRLEYKLHNIGVGYDRGLQFYHIEAAMKAVYSLQLSN